MTEAVKKSRWRTFVPAALLFLVALVVWQIAVVVMALRVYASALPMSRNRGHAR